MAYSAFTSGEVDQDSPLDATFFSKMKANFDAIVDGTALASNSIDQDNLQSSIVGQDELKTSTGSSSVVVTGGSSNTITLTGGTYSWWTTSANSVGVSIGGGGDTAAGTIGFYASSGNKTVYIDERYITASPPYDLGDGEIPLFLYAAISSNNELIGYSVAKDPTWAYNGPTDIRPTKTDKKTGKKYRKIKRFKDNGLSIIEAKQKTPEAFERWLTREEREVIEDEVEVDTNFKNSDMNLCPHPWFDNQSQEMQSATKVLLNPYSSKVIRLCDVFDDGGAREVANIIKNGFVKIDNQELSFKKPSGLIVVDFSWRNSKK